MSNLVLGIIIGILANILFAVILYGFNKVKLVPVQKLLNRFFKIGISRVYKNRKEANKFLYKENNETKSLKILTNRGYFFSSHSKGEESDQAVSLWKNLESAEVLLLNPNSVHTKNRYEEIVSFAEDKAWSLEHFKSDIKNSAYKLKDIPNVDVKLHNEPSIFRIVITDDNLYLSGFPSSNYGRDKPVYKIPKDSFLFDIFLKYFNSIWDRSKRYNEIY